ncbi:MAG: dTDP-4-dehydrorhamnose reductase [Gammaproteobacteria bacterium]
MRVLVTGATGQLGSDFCELAEHNGLEVLKPTRAEFDLEQGGDDIRRTITQSQADWVVNCAAYTDVDKAEYEADRAFKINRDAVRAIAQAVSDTGGRLMHISTDFVFNGYQHTPYTENDHAEPLNVYGKSKLEGELAAFEACPQTLLLRIGWIYGVRGHNFVKTILRFAAEREELWVVDDQYGSPSWTRDISDAMLALIRNACEGVYHFSNEGIASRFDLAVAIVDIAKHLGAELRITRIIPVASEDYHTPARRPLYSVLSKSKIRPVLKHEIPHWRTSLKKMLGEVYS